MRPKDWEKRHESYHCVHDDDDTHDAFEAGADAYEEGLKKEGIQIDANRDPVGMTTVNVMTFLDNCKNGYLVFIEE